MLEDTRATTMEKIGIQCLPGRGHLYPATALGRALKSHGHHVTVFSSLVARAIVKSAGLRFEPLSSPAAWQQLSMHTACSIDNGPSTLDVMLNHAAAVVASGSRAIRKEGIGLLLVDEADLAGGSVAEHLGIPFVTLCFFPPIQADSTTPPFTCAWTPSSRSFARKRIDAANMLFERLCEPIISLVNEYRREWKLAELQHLTGCFSKIAVITQLPRSLEFPQLKVPKHIHYTGLFSGFDDRRHDVPFPWDKLTGAPLVYACLGTVRNECLSIFVTICEALAAVDCQLVLSLGGTRIQPEDVPPMLRNAIVVHYAPQIAIMRRSALTICHGGLNTCLESIECGVPLVAIPIADDQPGVAARLRAHGIGTVLPRHKLTAKRLTLAVQRVLNNPEYRRRAKRMQSAIKPGDGLNAAVEIIQGIAGS